MSVAVGYPVSTTRGDEARQQTDGFPSVFQSFKTAPDVENYMNHLPEQCSYSSCSKLCSDAVVSAEGQEEESSRSTSTCDCCGDSVFEKHALCDACFSDPSNFADVIVAREGLVPEQAEILRSVARGSNIFFTGAAGTGKSKVIHAIQKYLRGLGAQVHTVAFSGIAAINVEGTTVHTYAGWDGNARRATLKELCERAHMKKIWKRFVGTDVLIIDEISMIESNNFTRLSQMLQAAMSTQSGGNGHRPFGGIQIIISGDFSQLPPVRPFEHCVSCGQETKKLSDSVRACEEHGEFELDDKFAFSSPMWAACSLQTVQLQHIHRQADLDFISILAHMRKGHYLITSEAHLLQNHPAEVDGDGATKLTPKNAEAAKTNDHHVGLLPTDALQYRASDEFNGTKRSTRIFSGLQCATLTALCMHCAITASHSSSNSSVICWSCYRPMSA